MLSVVISAKNDPIGCLFTARALLNEAKSIGGEIEIIIVDNSVGEDDWRLLNWLIDDKYKGDKIRLFRQDYPCLFTARDLGVEEARGKVVLILDSHMMVGKGGLVSLSKLFAEGVDVGIVYGPLVYHNKTHNSAYHSRDLNTFAALQFGELHQDVMKIPFRGAPFALEKEYYQKIGGYGILSTHKLSWGGGDAYIGIKSLLFGRTNYLLKDFTGIHIGPFPRDPYLCNSTEFVKTSGMRWMGVLVAGYALGGSELLYKRIERIRRRLTKFENYESVVGRVVSEVIRMGEEDRRWIRANAKYTYEEIASQWADSSFV